MSSQALLKRFDIVADQSANIPSIRRLVVDLAVRGKLLGIEELDVDVQEMLRRISSRTDELALSGAIKKLKPLSKIDNDEVPAAYLAHCTFARLGNIANLQKGLTGIQSSMSGEFPLVVTAAERGTCDHFDFDGAAAIIPLVSSTGHGNASINRLHYQDGKFALGTILCAVFPFDEQLVSARFLYEYLTAFKEELLVSKMIGTANVTLTLAKIAEVPVPIIAPAVQRRVDELMALCDQLEAAQQERERRRDRLAGASLQRLNQPAADTTPEAQRDHARFHLQNLPRLTTRPEHIKALRQLLVNLAVVGKLAQPEPNDEPAKVLLKKVWAEKKNRGLLKPVKERREGNIDLTVNSLPAGWVWTTFESFATEIATGPFGSALHQSDYIDGGIPLVNPSHMIDGRIVANPKISVTDETAKGLASYRMKSGDVVVARRGEVGRAAIVTDAEAGWLCGTGSFFVSFHDEIDRQFVILLLRSDAVRRYLAGEAVGTTMVNLNHGILKRIPLALPPAGEQHRIVAKVDELMALCDQLESQLTISQIDSHRLLGAVLDGALGIVRVPMDSEVGISPSSILDSDLQMEKASRFMTTNPAMNVDQFMECIDDLGGSALPDRLLKQTGLGGDVEAFYDLLRAARDSGKVTAPLGGGEIVRRHSNAD